MALFNEGHAAQRNLNVALHNVLIIAEECRQQHAGTTQGGEGERTCQQ